MVPGASTVRTMALLSVTAAHDELAEDLRHRRSLLEQRAVSSRAACALPRHISAD
jgi:hypothetical protein